MTMKYKNFLLIFNLTEAESDKFINSKEFEDGKPDIPIAIAVKLLHLLLNNIDSLKLPDITKSALKKLKSFIVKDKNDGSNENDSGNSSRPVTSSSEASSSS